MEDQQIVALYWQRDERAIDETRIKYSSYCRSIAQNILNSTEDAQECENDTYLAAWNAMPPHYPDILSTFLGKLTRRISLDRWKANTAQKRGGNNVALSLDELEDCIPNARTLEEMAEHKAISHVISVFLHQLPRRERQVFVRRYWYLDSIGDIADKFGFSESKVKMMLLRTRQKLRTYLEKEGLFHE